MTRETVMSLTRYGVLHAPRCGYLLPVGLLGPPTKFTTLVRAPPGLPAARVMEQLAEAGGGLPAHLQEVRLHAYHSSGA